MQLCINPSQTVKFVSKYPMLSFVHEPQLSTVNDEERCLHEFLFILVEKLLDYFIHFEDMFHWYYMHRAFEFRRERVNILYMTSCHDNVKNSNKHIFVFLYGRLWSYLVHDRFNDDSKISYWNVCCIYQIFQRDTHSCQRYYYACSTEETSNKDFLVNLWNN